MDNALEQAYPRPLSGHTVAVAPPALIPARAPTSAATSGSIRWNQPSTSHNSTYGPFPDEAAFTAWLRGQSATLERV
jgi:hypothetical protein